MPGIGEKEIEYGLGLAVFRKNRFAGRRGRAAGRSAIASRKGLNMMPLRPVILEV